MFYSKIKNMVDNNTGFCLGSLLWAVYIKSLGENVEISGNPCLGQEYDKSEAIEEIDYSINYYEKLKKDSKYYLALDYEINPEHIKYLEIYKDFLTLNEGFTKTKTSSDLKLPNTLTIPNTENLKIIYDKIQEVIKSGDLLNLQEVFNLVLKG